MSSPSHEHILGYVLGALEPDEREQFERELAKSPELARQVEQLAERLEPLEQCRDTEAPPAGLAARTCSFVFERIETRSVSEDRKVSLAKQGFSGAMSAEGAQGSSWTLSDAVVAAGIFIAAGLLFFPAIANSRYQAQLAQCQNNLRQMGLAHTAFRTAHPEIDLNNVAAMSGNRAFVGIQPIYWHDMGFSERDDIFSCPASKEVAEGSKKQIVTLTEVDQAKSDAEREAMCSRLPSSFAYSLGCTSKSDSAGDGVVPDSDFLAIAADAPSGPAPPQLVSTHHVNGENVLFDSGRVKFICGCGDEECGDSIYWNRDYRVAPGKDRRDIVLAPSGTWIKELLGLLDE